MPEPKQHISDLALICHRKGIEKVIISPGSRNAPLVKAFHQIYREECISIVDERSAAYFALGIAVFSQKPVVLICTSGTAALNYSPALAEAYYQQVPLLAITADRPRECIDQLDNQTIRQSGVYKNYIKRSYELPQIITSDSDLWYAHRIINEAVNLCTSPVNGPVHINVPLTEPLYELLPQPSENIKLIQQALPVFSIKLPDELLNEWNNATRIMIIHGQDVAGSEVSRILPLFSDDKRIILLAENISNIHSSNIIDNSNLVLSNNRSASPEYPQLILHSGGQVVSKALTGYLRRATGVACWRIGNDDCIIDTFSQVTRIVRCPPALVYRALLELKNDHSGSSYVSDWLNAAEKADLMLDEKSKKTSFCDLSVFHFIHRNIPSGSIVVFGNSSIIRYAQIFHADAKSVYFSNRGVSGIDGCLSASAGIAFSTQKVVLVVLGDLSFIYDSNALWNRLFPANLRILVINNSGGGIFHIIKGPSEQAGFKKLIEAHHPVNIHKLAEAFNLDYFEVKDASELSEHWYAFLNKQGRAAVMEVKTDPVLSASVFRQIMGSS
jgi:2-succinyl-5-enolpyruvyl-6-hydroxy-3-cyclohexene-1-carboxylate synthase